MAVRTVASFWAVSFLFLITPGANWAYAITAGLRHRTVLPAVGGLLAGHLLATAAVAAGLAVLLAGSPPVITALTAVGAAYLMRLGFATLVRRDVHDRPSSAGGAGSQVVPRVQDVTVTVDVLTEIVIERPCAEVAAYVGDPSHAPEWYVNIESVQWRTPEPVEVGSRVDFVARFLGRRLAYTYEVVDFVPGERLVMRTAQGPFPMETTYTWQPLERDSTRMTLRNRGEPAGFAKVTAPMMAAAVRRANQKDLANLKRILEARG